MSGDDVESVTTLRGLALRTSQGRRIIAASLIYISVVSTCFVVLRFSTGRWLAFLGLLGYVGLASGVVFRKVSHPPLFFPVIFVFVLCPVIVFLLVEIVLFIV